MDPVEAMCREMAISDGRDPDGLRTDLEKIGLKPEPEWYRYSTYARAALEALEKAGYAITYEESPDGFTQSENPTTN